MATRPIPQPADPLVTVIVVNHDRAELLRDCLQSLLSQDYSNFEVIVVDNGSSDGSIQLVRDWGDPRLGLVSLADNRGFADGNNRGIRKAQGEYVALLNNDATAHPSWLSSLMGVIRSRPEVGMCASKILFHGTRIIDKAGHLIYPDGQNRGRGTGDADGPLFDRLEEALFPDGCAALYRRGLLIEAGGFDEDFFAYADDADLGLRIRWLGAGCLYVPQAIVEHRHSSTSGRFSPQKVYWVERNRFWLALKNLPWPQLLASPFYTLRRWSWNAWAAWQGRGAPGEFSRSVSALTLLSTFLRAIKDGFLGAPRMWKKRRLLRKRRRISDRDFRRLVRRFPITARQLACQEFPNDASDIRPPG